MVDMKYIENICTESEEFLSKMIGKYTDTEIISTARTILLSFATCLYKTFNIDSEKIISIYKDSLEFIEIEALEEK